MKTTLLLAAAALSAADLSAHAQTTTLDWTETGSSFGNASGTLTIDSTTLGHDGVVGGYQDFGGTGYDYSVTAMTGQFTGGSLNGESVSLATFGLLNLSSSTPSTSLLGANIDLTAGGGSYTLAGGSYPSGNSNAPYGITTARPRDAGDDTFTLSPIAPIPESPLNPSLMAAAGLFIGWRSWRTVRAARA